MFKDLTDNQIKILFNNIGIGSISEIEPIKVGFSNALYSIDDKYVLKAAKSERDNEYLKREAYLSDLFKDRLPVPAIIQADIINKYLDRVFIIYEKIQGENLYMKWHELGVDERRRLVNTICSYMKIINETPYEEYAKRFKLDTSTSWQGMVLGKINNYLAPIVSQRLLDQDLINKIKAFVNDHKDALSEQRMALTYYDPHFDNFIVSDNRIVGILDFERTEIFSIDYVLDLIKRMVDYPKKYASAEAEQFIIPEDYSGLFNWYKEFYPELFNFKQMDMRLKLYAMAHDLRERLEYRSSDSEERLRALVG